MIFAFCAILWIVLVCVVSSMAKERGHSVAGFVLLAIFLSPIIAVIVLLILGPKKSDGRVPALNTEHRKCDFCAEIVKKEAIVCKHCGRDLPAYKPDAVEHAAELGQRKTSSEIEKVINDGVCPFCEAILGDSIKSCESCGMDLPSAA